MGEVLAFKPVGESWVDRHRDRYFDRKWLRSKRGNPYVRLTASDGHGCTVTVFRTPKGWKWSLVRSSHEGPFYARQVYATALEARAAAWDRLVRLEESA